VQRRIDEAARIREANEVNKLRLSSIKAKIDDGDGQIGGPATTWSPLVDDTFYRVQAMLRFRGWAADAYIDVSKNGHAAHIERLAEAKPSIGLTFPDAEDAATSERRASLRAASAERRQAETAARKAHNAEYFARIGRAATVTDTQIWDDGDGSAGAMRSVVKKQSAYRKAEEAGHLAWANKVAKERLSNVQAKTDDGDGLQF